MEMASTLYREQLPGLIEEGEVVSKRIDDTMVFNILKLKFELGLFDQSPYTDPHRRFPAPVNDHTPPAGERSSPRSCVLLKNHHEPAAALSASSWTRSR